METRLWVMTSFPILFSLVLIVTTNVGMVDIFVAIATLVADDIRYEKYDIYAAFQVVFIGTSSRSNANYTNLITQSDVGSLATGGMMSKS
jgi:uncharacterized ion transporter superfamily protein YfcC